jgi:protein-S-isoprenylcysteine O-methyltransferase Ste14
MSRFFGGLLGLGAHLLLVVTVLHLFPFLLGGQPAAGRAAPAWWWCDALLVVQFGLGHSALLLPAVRGRIERLLPGALYGCFFTVVTCLSLLLLIRCWRPCPVDVWRLEGWAGTAMCSAYLLSWGALLYSLSLSGFGFQTGWTPFWAWLRGRQPPRRRFEVRGAYQLLRHPVYLSFMGQVWLTPAMTLDRALLAGLLTVYLFLGSYLKDRRLVFYLGDVYRRYQARVPGYPFFTFGPLGRVPDAAAEAEPALASQ